MVQSRHGKVATRCSPADTFENLPQNVLSHADFFLTQTETDLKGLDASHSLTGGGPGKEAAACCSPADTFENLTQNVLSHADFCLTQTETDFE